MNPGDLFPSSHSKKAPPAVDKYSNASPALAFLIAASVSPPPARTSICKLLENSFIVSAIAIVLLSKGIYSNAPKGPFHSTDLDFKISSEINLVVCVPILLIF